MAPGQHLNYAKMANAVLFFLEQARDVGKTKLCKLLYFADFGHYAQHGCSITGEQYVKYPHGPVPSRLDLVLEKMRKAGNLDWTTKPVFDYQRVCYQVKKPCDETVFTAEERATLNDVAERWRCATAATVEAASHGHAAWLAADEFAFLDYSLAVCSNEPEPEDDELRNSAVLHELVKGLN